MINYTQTSDYYNEYIYHYNHNHDPRNGQFTTGPNGRAQTKYGFKEKGGRANAVKKALLKTAYIPLVNVPGVIGAAIAEAKEVRYTPGDTSDKHYIKKGTKMYRVSAVDKENNIGETYVTYNPVDRAFYRAYIQSRNPGSKVYETTFKSKEDLVVPSQKELAEVQKKVIWDNPKLKKKSIEGFSNFRSYGDYRNEKISEMKKNYDELNKKTKISNIVNVNPNYEMNKFVATLKNGKTVPVGPLDDKTYIKIAQAIRYSDGTGLKKQLLNQIKEKKISQFSVISLSMGTSKELKGAMIKELKKRGYNSMVDEAGVGVLEVPGINDKKSGKVSREGVEPIIVFDRSQSLKAIKTKEVGNTNGDLTYYNRWRNYKDHGDRKITW